MADLTKLVADALASAKFLDDNNILPKTAHDCRTVAAALEAQQAEIAALMARAEAAEKDAKEWRSNYRSLEKAIVGDTGLSAMLIATQARLFRPRAEAAEAKVAQARQAWAEYEAAITIYDHERAVVAMADALREIGGGNG